jgi:hypothetical protein
MDLTETLRRLYDSEINVTITTLWDDGWDFALVFIMEWEEAGRPIDYMQSFISVEQRERPDRANPWHGVRRAEQLPRRSTTPRLASIRILITRNATDGRTDPPRVASRRLPLLSAG